MRFDDDCDFFTSQYRRDEWQMDVEAWEDSMWADWDAQDPGEVDEDCEEDEEW
jgi:hypothetical protein